MPSSAYRIGRRSTSSGDRRTAPLQLSANIAVLASIYALISCGYVLIYRVSRVLSLAHGELMLLGAYGLYATASLFSGSPALAIAMSALLAAMIGVLVYALLMRRMTGESVLAAVLVTIALGILVRGVTVLVWSTQERHPLQVLGWSNPSIAIGENARVSGVGLAFVAITAVVYAALYIFLRHTHWGIRMRAAGQNPLLAAQRGINLHGVYALAWALATFTGGVAGMLVACDNALDQTMRLGLIADRGIQYSYDINQPYYLLTGVSGSIAQQVFGPLDVVGRAGAQQLAYRDRTAAVIRASNRTDQVRMYGGGLGFHLGRDLRIGANIDHYKRTSPVTNRQYEGLRFGTSVTYGS